MVPRATMQKMTNVKVDLKPKKTVVTCFEPKSIEIEEEDVNEDDEGDVDFLGLKKIDEMPDVAPVSGFELPEVNSNTTKIEEDRVYGPVYCPESNKSDVYEDDETKLTLDSNAVCLFHFTTFFKNYCLKIFVF